MIARLSLLTSLLCLSACTGWHCMAQPTVGRDAKSGVQIYGFKVHCTQP